MFVNKFLIAETAVLSS